jgi:hypothetical protein
LVDRLGLGYVGGDVEINVPIDDRADFGDQRGIVGVVDRKPNRESVEQASLIGRVVGGTYGGKLLQPIPGVFLYGCLRAVGAKKVGLEGREAGVVVEAVVLENPFVDLPRCHSRDRRRKRDEASNRGRQTFHEHAAHHPINLPPVGLLGRVLRHVRRP